jgi:hypothetical protein
MEQDGNTSHADESMMDGTGWEWNRMGMEQDGNGTG